MNVKLRKTARIALTGGALSMVLAVLPAGTANAVSSRTVQTTSGRTCSMEVSAYKANFTVVVPAVNFWIYGYCPFQVLDLYGQAYVYESGTYRDTTGLVECECPPYYISQYHTYYPALPNYTYYADGDVTIELLHTAEKWVTPAPSGCVVYNNGWSIWCNGMRDYA